MTLDYLALESEPKFRPKVHKIQIKQYGLRKVVRVGTRKNGGNFVERKKTKKADRS